MNRILILPLFFVLVSCASSGTMRIWEDRLALVSTSLGNLATDLEQAETSGQGKYTELGSQVGTLVGRLADVAREAKEAGDAAGDAASEGEENAARITAITGAAASGLTGLGPLGELIGMGVAAAGVAYVGVMKKRDGNRAKRNEAV